MIVRVEQVTSWLRALNAARWTMGKAPSSKEPSNEWKDKIIRAEHSPIRLVEFDIWLEDIPAFVAGHLVRHHQGVEKFQCTNREDRRDVNPEEINRLTPVNLMLSCNVQALINISRKRLCKCAHAETIKVWQAVKDAIAKIDPIVAKNMVAECLYKGCCLEMNSCKYWMSMKYEKEYIYYRTPYIEQHE